MKEVKLETVAVPVQLVVAIRGYLEEKPFKEVFELYGALNQAVERAAKEVMERDGFSDIQDAART